MLLSFIVPVYNVEDYLEKCVESITLQSYKKIEIILVDDGSTDSSGEKCDMLAEKDNRIRVIHKQNGGLGYARNTGIENAAGDYLFFVDSDDYIEPESIAGIVDFIKHNPDAEIYFYGHNTIEEGEEKRQRGTPPTEPFYNRDECLDKIFLNALGLEPKVPGYDFTGISACMATYKRDFIEKEKIRFLSERDILSEDILFNLEVVKKISKAYVIPEYMYTYVTRKTSLTQTYREDRFKAAVRLYNEIVLSLKEIGYDGTKDARVGRALMVHYLVCIKSLVENENKLGKKYIISELKNLSEEKTFKQVIKDYPIKNLSLPQRVLFRFYKHKMAHMIYFITKIKVK